MRIALAGSHGVGKTTLLDKINLPGHRKIQETARDEIMRRGRLPHEMDPHEFFDFQLTLVRLQHRTEAGDFIIDRSIFDMLAYAMDHHNYHLIRRFIERCYRPYDYIFYIPIEFDLVVDDVRKDDLDYQRIIDERIRKIFKTYQLDYHIIRGSLEQRSVMIHQLLAYGSKN